MISRRTQAARDRHQKDVFYQAIYNQSKCDFLFAKHQKGDAKTKSLNAAEQAVLYVYRVRPELGGPEWHEKFNNLLKIVQEAQGKKAVGLPADVAKPAAGAAKVEAVSQAK